MGCKRVTIFFILTHLRHDWDTGTVAPKVHKRCTRGAREVHERCTRGAREGHERGRRGAFVGTKGDTVFFILTRLGHGWDTVGTRGHWRHRCTRGAREGHERCTRGAREGHKRGTRGAREGHERCTRGASLNFPTTARSSQAHSKCMYFSDFTQGINKLQTGYHAYVENRDECSNLRE